MKKRMLSLILVVIMLLTSNMFLITNAATFTDVAPDHWAINYIKSIEERGIINGYGDGRFGPENKVKTGELIKMASMTLWPKYQYKTPKSGDHWAVPYLYTLHYVALDVSDYNNEILETEITRGETVKIMASIYVNLNPEAEIDTTEKYVKTYLDEEGITDTHLRKSINICSQFGIISGFPDGTFRADETLTRAQAAKIIYTTINN